MYDFIKNLSLLIQSFFHERRCILCTRPFIPSPTLLNQHDFATILNSPHTKTILCDLENKCLEHIASHLCEHCSNPINSTENSNSTFINTTTHIHQNSIDQSKPYKRANTHYSIKIKQHSYCKLCGEIFHHDKSHFSTQRLCAKCSQNNPEWSRFYFINTYEKSLRQLILNAKFQNSTTALSFLGKLLAYTWIIKLLEETLETQIANANISKQETLLSLTNIITLPHIIIPMPLHSIRLKERGYNQCILLTKYFHKECSRLFKKYHFHQNIIPKIDIHSLKRIQYTQAQSDLNQKERIQNVKNVFQVENKKDIENKRILLIDDIATTNSTLKEASRTLLNAGASQIDILIIAKTPH